MKQLLLAGTFLAATLCGAQAADIRPAPPVPSVMTPVSVYDWSGFYLGINAGGLWNGESGGLIGATAGFNFQTGPLVLGLEGDLAYFSAGGGNTFRTIRGRIGYAAWDRLLPYLTAGGAFTGGTTSGVIGAGLEYAFTPALSVKGEYLYAGMNGGSHILRVGLNYRFLAGGPLFARY